LRGGALDGPDDGVGGEGKKKKQEGPNWNEESSAHHSKNTVPNGWVKAEVGSVFGEVLKKRRYQVRRLNTIERKHEGLEREHNILTREHRVHHRPVDAGM
jgi:hypothetical protein